MRLALAFCLTALPALAESPALPAPRDAALAQALQDQGLQTALTYAASADVAKPEPPPPPEAPRLPGGQVSAFWVLGLAGVALALWLRFGGKGVLTRRAPQEGVTVEAPAHWQLDRSLTPAALIDQIAAMEDKTAALVRLLRHCLLRAAEDSRTRLARADTEREAFARLPGERPGLRLILQAAELAHYGGRPVSAAGLAEALEQGRAILGGGHG